MGVAVATGVSVGVAVGVAVAFALALLEGEGLTFWLVLGEEIGVGEVATSAARVGLGELRCTTLAAGEGLAVTAGAEAAA